jgi:hypothetical protein
VDHWQSYPEKEKKMSDQSPTQITRVLPLLERFWEPRFVLKFLSLALFLNVFFWAVLGKSVLALSFSDIAQTPGHLIAALLVFCVLCSFVLPSVHFLVSVLLTPVLLKTYTKKSYDDWIERTHRSWQSGYVTLYDAEQDCFKSQNEFVMKAVRAAKERKEANEQDRATLNTLLFTSLCLISADLLWSTKSLGISILELALPLPSAFITALHGTAFCLLVLFVWVWLDYLRQRESDTFVRHPELAGKNFEELNKRQSEANAFLRSVEVR